jgi:hypothetical protein
MRFPYALLALPFVALLTLSGCTGTNVAELAKALGKDSGTLCIRTHVIYGIGNGEHTLYRTNITNGVVVCDEKGLQVKSVTPGT